MHLLDLLQQNATLRDAAQNLKPKTVVALAKTPSASWGAIAAFLQAQSKATTLVVAPDGETAERCANDLRALFDDENGDNPHVLFFPTPERTGDESDLSSTRERLGTLDALHNEQAVVVVTTAKSLSSPTLPPTELKHGYDEIKVGQTLERDAFLEHLSSTGFERVEEVEQSGQFAGRGGIIDFFPPASQSAIRLELFGDEVDSLRFFDVATQRSTEKTQSVRLTPPREVYLSREKGQAIAAHLQTILDEQSASLRDADVAEHLRETVGRDIERLRDATYFAGLDRYRALLYPERPTLLEHLPEDATVVWCDPNRAQSQVNRVLEDEERSHELNEQEGAALRLPTVACDYETLRERSKSFAQVELHLAGEVLAKKGVRVLEMPLSLPPTFSGKLDQLLGYVREQQNHNAIIVLSSAHSRRAREIMADGGIRHVHLLDSINETQPSLVLVMPQRLSSGFEIEIADAKDPKPKTKNQRLVVLTDAEMFGWQRVQPHLVRKKKKQQSSTRTGSALTNLSELKEGDYVVHISHGIARYGGVVRQQIAGAINDYLALEYEGKDRLYVPVGQLDRVQKYLGTDASPPPLSNLKSGNWEKTKKKVREETIAVARQLSELYAAREQAHKEPIAPDSPWQREMEAAFPYEETAGQLQAIEETKGDLESDRPMDRLVCGDVGYGKTEVAIRAAFKVVQDGKQVAVLVPTTVLAQQHYQTFSERLAAYPTRVEVISRFRTPGEIKKVVEDVRLGAVDILVGTHRLVQKDVEFRDLGLVIVDEEQRFGVMQKERLKELRKEVDILTLSATPIPRTLHFALGGLREMSLISDPPLGRLPVRTVVSPMRDDVVRQAIERELEREGQVYYVHNRISSIHHIAEHIRKLVPRARIGIGHGQMGDEELEQVMLDFMHGRSDILLSTTIIENGLDLPNVNTLIVDRAELLGLSQMYQLRGRVGRSPRQGYAYFFHGARGKLTETSEGRFAAIQEFTDLGAGFKIAMRDLEIRGAGDLLGVKQSGGIAQVGFELYTEMLNDAVQKLKRQPKIFTPRKVELPEVDLPVPAFLPDDYVKDQSDRLNLYRKMANAQSVEDAESLREELRDRFGALPQPAFNLIRVLKLRVWLLQARLRGISKTESEVLIRLQPGDKFQDEDTSAVYAKLQKSFDHRALHNVSLRSREGIAIDTRVLSPSQLMRMIEETSQTLATIRGARFLAMSG